MAESVIIPTQQLAFYSIRCTLDGEDYTLDFSYNTREARWYFDIYDSENEPLLYGIKVICQFPLFLYQQDALGLPPGTIYCVSPTQDQSPPQYGELGENARCQLVYFPEDPSTIS